MTEREQKSKEWFKKYPKLEYHETVNHNIIYWEFTDGDWGEYDYNEKRQLIFNYTCWILVNNIGFMNIIIK